MLGGALVSAHGLQESIRVKVIDNVRHQRIGLLKFRAPCSRRALIKGLFDFVFREGDDCSVRAEVLETIRELAKGLQMRIHCHV